MDSLRWILLLLGLALIVGIYLLGRRHHKREQTLLDVADEFDVGNVSRRTSEQPEPEALDGITDQLEELNDLLNDAPSARRGRTGDTEPVTMEKIVAIHIAAPRGNVFGGPALLDIFGARGYEFGEHSIYHSRHNGQTVFSVVNMVKPGWFDPDQMDDFTTPGISLFLRLPGPLAANVALDVLIAESRALADALDGILQDETHSTVTQQTLQHLREEVMRFARATEREPHS